uniref:Uncharacterized protein n=1 Tax=Sphaerodactylus townsendi TaxID=933632 RepID=A0ACB8G5M0_9SAUR
MALRHEAHSGNDDFGMKIAAVSKMAAATAGRRVLAEKSQVCSGALLQAHTGLESASSIIQEPAEPIDNQEELMPASGSRYQCIMMAKADPHKKCLLCLEETHISSTRRLRAAAEKVQKKKGGDKHKESQEETSISGT